MIAAYLKYLAVLFSILASYAYVIGQQPVFRNYTTHDGLPSSETYCVMQDSRGYIYIGTDRGIARFDGQKFTVLTSTNGLPDNTIFELHEDPQKRIWYQSYSSNIGYLHNDSSFVYPFNNAIKKVQGTDILHSLKTSRNGSVWINCTTENNGISIRSINRNGEVDSSIKLRGNYTDIYYFNDGRCLLSGKNGKNICLVDAETGKTLQTFVSNGKPDNKAFVYKRADKTYVYVNNYIHVLTKNGSSKTISCDGEVLYMLIDKKDNIWVGYHYKGLELYSAANNYHKPLIFLKNNSVSGITEDREGGLWFSSLENGIYYLPPGFLFSFDKNSGFPISKVSRISNLNGKGAVILSDFTLLSFESGNEAWDWKTYNGSVSNVLYNNNRLYYATYNVPKGWVDKKNIFIQEQKIIQGRKYLWGFSSVWARAFDSLGSCVKTFKFTGMPRAICLFEKSENRVLIGTLEGLYEVNDKGNIALKAKNPLFGYRISDIKRLNSQYFLIATMGQGLLLVDEKEDKILKNFTDVDGLSSIMCHTILCENDSTVWVGTNNGLCKITNILSPQKIRFFKADISMGIISNEINDLCIIGENLWIGTSSGLTIFPKNKKMDAETDIPVIISSLYINNIKSQSFSTEYNYNQNNIGINFIGINYQFSGKLLYKYRLEGTGNHNWNYTTTPSIIYNSLPPGEYTFQCAAIAPNQLKYGSITSFSFTIHPAIWQTWWFKTLLIAFIVVALVFTVYFFVQRKKDSQLKTMQQKRKLAELELEAIKAQINPHFIFNCLNSIQAFSYDNEHETVKEYMRYFAKLIRQTMDYSQETFITLGEETDYLANYLRLEKIRFKDKLDYILEVDKELSHTRLLPAMLVQPYVENALKHGRSSDDVYKVKISFSGSSNGDLYITIQDNGQGIVFDKHRQNNKSLGLRLSGSRVNTYNQLFSLGIKLQIQSNTKNTPPLGTTVILIIPSITHEHTLL